MVWVFSCCRVVNSARHRRKCNATSLVFSSQTHWWRSSCLRWLNATYVRHLANDVDIKRLLCRTTACSNLRRVIIAVSRASHQRRKLLRTVPGINDKEYIYNISHLSKLRLNSLYFVINRICMKISKTSNIDIVKYCQSCFGFDMPSNLTVLTSLTRKIK